MMNLRKFIFVSIILLFITVKPVWSGKIHKAAKKGYLKKVEKLLKRNPDLINAKDKNGKTPLHLSIYGGHKNVIDLLVTKGVDVNAKDEINITPLHIAAIKGQSDIISLLISKGADVNSKDINSRTPLHWSTSKICYGTTIEEILAFCSFTGDYRKTVELLVAKGADVNAKDNGEFTPLHFAAVWNLKILVELLIARGAKVDAINNNGHTPLHLSAGYGYKEVAEVLISKGADLNAIGKQYSETPLHLAINWGHIEVVKLLISKGAEVNVKDRIGLTPLHYAAHKGEAAQFYAGFEVQYNEKKNTWTIINYSRPKEETTQREIAQLLISNEAELNMKDNHGMTPLHYAVRSGYGSVVRLLIENGAEINIKNTYGISPLQYAHCKDIKRLLRKYGAIEINPDDYETWYNKGNTLYGLGKHNEAIKAYDKAIEIKPDKHEAWYNKGNALYRLRRYIEAIKAYNKALEICKSKNFKDDSFTKLIRKNLEKAKKKLN